MCEIIKKALADGYSKEAGAGILGITKATLYRWIEEKQEFKDAIMEGEAMSQKWWEDAGRQACVDGKINGQVWMLNMRNRFGYTVEEKHTVLGNVEHRHTFEKLPETDGWIAEAIGSEESAQDPKTRPH